jgi:serine/threonine protein kinase
LNPELPLKLEEIIHKALQTDRTARYQAASEMRAALKSVAAGLALPKAPRRVPLRRGLREAAQLISNNNRTRQPRLGGIPITDYCDKHKLTTRQRLELFILVCEGVQHAHQKAIIHRDLKPSNILVSGVDGKAMPRIIDFGVAKATSQELSAGTMYTRLGTVIGTLGYMSPEQADSGGEDIDTRTDVYSLSVVLYELLVGALPFDFQKLAFDEVLRCLREQDAPRPSTKLRRLGGQSAITAQNRGARNAALSENARRSDPWCACQKRERRDRQTKLPRERRTRGTRGSAAPSAAERRRKHVTDGVVRLSAAGLQAAGLNDFEMGDPLPQLQRVANLKTPVLPAFRECPPRIVAMRGDAGPSIPGLAASGLDWRLRRYTVGRR